MKVPDRDGIVKRALEEIHPAANKRNNCEQMIRTYLGLLDQVKAQSRGSSPAEFRDDMAQFAKLLKRLKAEARTSRRVFEGISEFLAPVDYDRFMADVMRLIDIARFWAEHVVMTHGAKPVDPVKMATAFYGVELKKQFGSKQTSTALLASILYEGAIGIRDADLEGYIARVKKSAQPVYAKKIPRVKN